MSVVFLVVPTVAVSWPLLCGAAAAAGAALGYKALKSLDDAVEASDGGATSSAVEMKLDGSSILAESLEATGSFVLSCNEITATFSRGADGACSVHVEGTGKTEEELRLAGQRLINKITQQYAYNKVVTDLKAQGFTVNHEEVDAQDAVHIRVSRYV